jgi:hypothetical protein
MGTTAKLVTAEVLSYISDCKNVRRQEYFIGNLKVIFIDNTTYSKYY